MGGAVAEVKLNSGRAMPVVGLGTASYPPATPENFQSAILQAVALGFRHFDTGSIYWTEEKLGEALAEALRQGLVKSREELFVTTKIWGNETHAGRVLPALRQSLRKLQLDYLDLYLIHWPASLKSKEFLIPIDKADIVPLDLKSVWGEMEECQRLGLVKSLGVSNFSSKKVDQLLAIATIPPSVNQVEMHPVWQQQKLIDFCKEKGVHVSAYSPLGGHGTPWGSPKVLECDVLREIAAARGKSVAQISLRWIYEQGSSVVSKTFKKERMIENLDIFDFELSDEELQKISQIPQSKGITGESFVSDNGPYKTVDELWDGEI